MSSLRRIICQAWLGSGAPSLRAAQDGVSTVEFAVIVPFLCLMVLGILDFGVGLWEKLQVDNAARAGAEYATGNTAQSGFNSAAIQRVVTSATSLSSIQAIPAPSQSCGCPNANGLTTTSCNAGCSGGGTAGVYVTVSAQASYSTLMTWPGISNPVTLSSTVVARVQ